MITLLDGGMGTEIRRRGCNVPSHLNSIWSAQALMDNPEVVRQIHTDYINAGADIIITNNYAVTHNLLKRKNIWRIHGYWFEWRRRLRQGYVF